LLDIETARDWYSPTDPVHGFDHVLRVYRLAAQLAQEEGADQEIVAAAVLLHDVQTPSPTEHTPHSSHAEEQRANHHLDAASPARQVLQEEGWSIERIEAVIDCIAAHRFRNQAQKPQTMEAKVVFDADKLDAIGAIGVARAIGYSVTHGQPVFSKPSEHFLSHGETEAGEPHSAYHEYLYKLCKLKDMLYTPTARSLAETRHQFMQSFFDQLAEEYSDTGW